MPTNKPESLFVVNIITGISDGIILPFVACVIAYPFFKTAFITIPKIGFLVSLTGAVIYGLARYLGEKSEIHHHHPQLSREEAEKEYALMKYIGIEDQLNSEIKNQMEKEKELWLSEVMENKLGWHEEDRQRTIWSGVQTGVGFFVAGCMILIPVLFLIRQDLLPLTSVLSIILVSLYPLTLLFLFGGFKALFVGRPFLPTALKMMMDGLMILIIAFVIAAFINQPF